VSADHPLLSEAFVRLGVPDHVRALIIERHSEPHRHYHTLRHIDLMLGQLPASHGFAREMIVATLFHDIVYDPVRSDNEELSVSTFLSLADRITPGAPLDADLVTSMILATKNHHFREDNDASDRAINILLKADLSILWHQNPQVYEWYARGVRQEYAFVPEGQFRAARARILAGLRDDLLRSNQLTPDEANVLTRNTDWELNQGQ
jgi:predicted metal-dependent HD superfamily phosphohydrolase